MEPVANVQVVEGSCTGHRFALGETEYGDI
jgi:hypothetical protein